MTRARALLGCIADDFTGATDLANNLVRAGMRVRGFVRASVQACLHACARMRVGR